jgi:hypothetical protein
MILCGIDFEYKNPADPDMGLISCALCIDNDIITYWLWDGSDKSNLVAHLGAIRETHILVGYSIQQADARCLAALGLNPTDWQWRDLLAEWKWLRNCDNAYSYGHVITDRGLAQYSVPPIARTSKKASQEDLDEAKSLNDDWLEQLKGEYDGLELSMGQAGFSLLDALYFFELISFDDFQQMKAQKDQMREGTILAQPPEALQGFKAPILAYNAGDVGTLLELAQKITTEMLKAGESEHCMVSQGNFAYHQLDLLAIIETQRILGTWSARLAKYANRGIPLNPDRLTRLLEVVPEIQKTTRASWNEEYPLVPLYRVGFSDRILGLKKSGLKNSPYKTQDLSFDTSYLADLIEKFCDEYRIENWPRTRTGKLDTSKKVIQRFATGENILKQFERHKSMLATLQSFSKTKGDVAALKYIGEDCQQRPDYGDWGTQTSRNAHKTKSFMPGMAHVFRILVDPPEGEAIVALDFGSEEIFISAVLSGDQVMKKMYLTEDYYMAYAQYVGMYPDDLPIPTEAQREEEWFKPYKKIRSIAKTLCLSMSYGAGARSIAAAVRIATRDEEIDDDQGFVWVNEYKEAVATYTAYVDRLREEYKEQKTPLMLANGWRLGVDQFSPLSASNFPSQGSGACILQRACKLLDDAGLQVIFTVHDEIACQCKASNAQNVASKMRECMLQASKDVLGEDGMKIGNPEIINHGDWWLHSDKAERSWEKLKKYFITEAN